MTLTGPFIALCWAVFLGYWLVTAFRAKRTAVRRLTWLRFALIAAAIGGVLLLRSDWAHSRNVTVLPATLPVGVAADALALAGLVIMLWARTVLGGNWSADVALKRDHELIEHGPYAYVRHPIYTGLLLLGLASAMFEGTVGALIVLLVCVIGFWIRARAEERLMTEHFPERYPAYKARTRALIPFVI